MSRNGYALESNPQAKPADKAQSPVDYISLMAGARPSASADKADGSKNRKEITDSKIMLADAGKDAREAGKDGDNEKKPETRFDGDRFADALKTADKLGRKVVIDAGASWCLPCRKMDKETWGGKDGKDGDPKVKEELDKNYVLIKLDMDKHQKLAEQLGIKDVPTVLIGRVKGGAFEPEKPAMRGYKDAKTVLEKLQEK